MVITISTAVAIGLLSSLLVGILYLIRTIWISTGELAMESKINRLIFLLLTWTLITVIWVFSKVLVY